MRYQWGHKQRQGIFQHLVCVYLWHKVWWQWSEHHNQYVFHSRQHAEIPSWFKTPCYPRLHVSSVFSSPFVISFKFLKSRVSWPNRQVSCKHIPITSCCNDSELNNSSRWRFDSTYILWNKTSVLNFLSVSLSFFILSSFLHRHGCESRRWWAAVATILLHPEIHKDLQGSVTSWNVCSFSSSCFFSVSLFLKDKGLSPSYGCHLAFQHRCPLVWRFRPRRLVISEL